MPWYYDCRQYGIKNATLGRTSRPSIMLHQDEPSHWTSRHIMILWSYIIGQKITIQSPESLKWISLQNMSVGRIKFLVWSIYENKSLSAKFHFWGNMVLMTNCQILVVLYFKYQIKILSLWLLCSFSAFRQNIFWSPNLARNKLVYA
jgi:hypothetical protein